MTEEISALTEEDIGSWYITASGDYAKLLSPNPSYPYSYTQKIYMEIHYKDGVIENHNLSIYNLERKLDPIEVNLLRLEQRSKDARK